MLVDSHCHLDFAELENDFNNILTRAASRDVAVLQTICTRTSDFYKVIKIAALNKNIYCSFGVHPLNVKEGTLSHQQIISLCGHAKIVGLGETGLDYYYDNQSIELQKLSFIEHIKAAQQTGLPLIIHTRDAEEDTLQILQDMLKTGSFKGVIHCFTGTKWFAQECLKLGFYISFSGIITIKNAKDLQEIAKFVPLDRCLVETDSPYLAPMPYRGKRNEPSYVKEVAECLAILKNLSFAEISAVTTENFFQLFDKAKRVI